MHSAISHSNRQVIFGRQLIACTIAMTTAAAVNGAALCRAKIANRDEWLQATNAIYQNINGHWRDTCPLCRPIWICVCTLKVLATKWTCVRTSLLTRSVVVGECQQPIQQYNQWKIDRINWFLSSCLMQLFHSYLHKLGATFHGWSRRWFVLDRQKMALIYYSDKSERKPRGGAYFSVYSQSNLYKLSYAMECTTRSTANPNMEFKTEFSIEFDFWLTIDAINTEHLNGWC